MTEKKNYQALLFYGYEDGESGIWHAFELADPEKSVDDGKMAGKLAKALECEASDADFSFDSMFVQLPRSLVARIKADGVREYRQRRDRRKKSSKRGKLVPPPGVAAVQVTLVRTRQDGLHMEIYTDNFCVLVPQTVVKNGQKDVEDHVRMKLKRAAWELVTGPDMTDLIVQSCNDFNWGDFAMYFRNNYALHVYSENPFGSTSMSIDLRVDQDECLIPSSSEMKGRLLFVNEDGVEEDLGEVEYDRSSWSVPVDFEPSETGAYFLQFETGFRHPVAKSESEARSRDDVCFWLESEQ